MTREVQKMMSLLHCSEAEALDVIESDKRIDRGEKLFELTQEQQQTAKEMRQAPRTPTVYKFKQRERKAIPEKSDLCSAMIEGLRSIGVETVEVANAEREFSFTHNGTRYKVVMSCPRK